MTAFWDAVYAIGWQATMLGVIVAAAGAVDRLFPDARGAERWLPVSVLALAMVLSGLTVIGGLGLISSTSVFVAVAAVAGGVWLAARWLAVDPVRVEQSELSDGPQGAAAVWGVAAALLVGHVICNGLLRIPTDWDTLMYHLPFIDHWIQNGTLEATQSARWSMPAANELLGLWFAAPFSGDFLIALNNVPVVIIWALATIELARALGLSGWWPHLMAVCCLSVQTTVRQTVDASNDLLVVAMFTGGMVYVLRYAQSRHGTHAFLFGVCLGILGSVKYFAIGYAVVLAALFFIVFFARPASDIASNHGVQTDNRSSSRWSQLFRTFALVAIPATVCGGYWYARNVWMTGYPLFPIGTSQFADRLPYPGLHNTMLLFHPTSTALDLVVDSIWRNCGPVQSLALVAAPTMALWLAVEFYRPRGGPQTRSGVLLFCLLGSFAVYIVTPMLVEDQPGTLNQLHWGYTTVRYGLSFLSCATITLVVGMARFTKGCQPRGQQIVLGLTVALVVYQVVDCWYRIEAFDREGPIIIAACAAMLVLLISRIPSTYAGVRAIVLTSGGLLVASGVGYLSQFWHAGFTEHYDGYRRTLVYGQLATQPCRILVLDERSYPYFGSCRQNYIRQPMLYYGADDVVARMESENLDFVAARIESQNAISRYRSAWQELGEDARFEDCTPSESGDIRLFRLRGVRI